VKVTIEFELPEVANKKELAKTLVHIIARSIPVDEIDTKIQGERDFYVSTSFNLCGGVKHETY